eukprot:1160042-Pelagomonas_calceolata.AAC.9
MNTTWGLGLFVHLCHEATNPTQHPHALPLPTHFSLMKMAYARPSTLRAPVSEMMPMSRALLDSNHLHVDCPSRHSFTAHGALACRARLNWSCLAGHASWKTCAQGTAQGGRQGIVQGVLVGREGTKGNGLADQGSVGSCSANQALHSVMHWCIASITAHVTKHGT